MDQLFRFLYAFGAGWSGRLAFMDGICGARVAFLCHVGLTALSSWLLLTLHDHDHQLEHAESHA